MQWYQLVCIFLVNGLFQQTFALYLIVQVEREVSVLKPEDLGYENFCTLGFSSDLFIDQGLSTGDSQTLDLVHHLV